MKIDFLIFLARHKLRNNIAQRAKHVKLYNFCTVFLYCISSLELATETD